MPGTVSVLGNYGLEFSREKVSPNCAAKVCCGAFRRSVSYVQKRIAALAREGSTLLHFQQHKLRE